MSKIGFQPIPKHFMVWDKEKREFMSIADDDGYDHFIIDISALDLMLDEYGYSYDDIIICQSTNLFDKDGREIWEGSIVKSFDNINKISDPYLAPNTEPTYRTVWVEYIKGAYHLSSREYPNGGCGILDNYCGAMAKDLEVIGHILSNPELIYEKKGE